MRKIPEATGASITAAILEKETRFDITAYGACSGGNPVANTKAVNRAIEAASVSGGCVVFPEGEYKVYTIRLKSNVNLYLEKGALIRAARTDIKDSYEKQVGEGGNYDEPEVNIYTGLQDHGHSYFANSLIYGCDLENIMIYGEGVIDGSCYDEETGYRQYVLQGGDPFDQSLRSKPGHAGEWFGNKTIALDKCRNIVMNGFSIVIGGHFAVIATGVVNMLIDHVCLDTTRDALDIDCCQDVTVRNSIFNSLTDDGVVMKASYGAGIFMPTRNVLIEDCTVSGYDAGSVYAKTYTRDKLIATDRCGPTGRVKFGTESTCGYDLVTIRRVHFERARGFAMEAVDGSDLSNVIFTDCTLNEVSSSPIFIKIGDRARFPVTGNAQTDEIIVKDGNVRLDNRSWVLPDTDEYQTWPAKRYVPSYNRTREVSVDGHSYFSIVDENDPVKLNPANYAEIDGKYYAVQYIEGQGYQPDLSKALNEDELSHYANAVGVDKIASVHDIEISNVTITNADPRYPIILMGLVDSKIHNVAIKNISVEYRGGMKWEHAVEQRQLNTNWEYSQFETAPSVQTLPWLVNTFFLKAEGLLPRVDYDAETKSWKDDPYNVPELPEVYPEPSNWGILPAYGLYARHIEGLELDTVTFRVKVEDERHAMVFDDAKDIHVHNLDIQCAADTAAVALVTNHYKRPTNLEYIPNLPYQTTSVTDIELPEQLTIQFVTVDAPAPGTPEDSLYQLPTVAIPENGYHFAVPTEEYPLPKTVFRPFFQPVASQQCRVGETLSFSVAAREPAKECSEQETSAFIYNESVKHKDYVVKGQPDEWMLRAENLPDGAEFDAVKQCFTWKPKTGQAGRYPIRFVVSDGIIEECMEVDICVISA